MEFDKVARLLRVVWRLLRLIIEILEELDQ
jgi:hypothetical protein